MKLTFIVGMILAAVLFTVAKEPKQFKPQTTCPVMGGKISPKMYAEQNSKRIYVCCEPCISKIENDFTSYEQKLNKKGQQVETVKVEKEAAAPVETEEAAATETKE